MSKSKLKLKKGDKVVVISGKDKGTKGEILAVLTDERRVVVKGVNVATHHRKPSQFAAGGLEKAEASIDISNVALADPKSGKATRVGYKAAKDGTKVRVARKSGESIE